jgi:hypothetical protein
MHTVTLKILNCVRKLGSIIRVKKLLLRSRSGENMYNHRRVKTSLEVRDEYWRILLK